MTKRLIIEPNPVMDVEMYRKVDTYFKKRFLEGFKRDYELGRYNHLTNQDISEKSKDVKFMAYFISSLKSVLWGLVTKANSEILEIDYDDMIKSYADEFNKGCERLDVHDLEMRLTPKNGCGFKIYYKFSEYGYCDIEDVIDYLLCDV